MYRSEHVLSGIALQEPSSVLAKELKFGAAVSVHPLTAGQPASPAEQARVSRASHMQVAPSTEGWVTMEYVWRGLSLREPVQSQSDHDPWQSVVAELFTH
jgi:hypothetical protein